MEVTATDVERVPGSNIRVPRLDFGVLWSVAEHRHGHYVETGTTDWYAAGVVASCRWLARASLATRSPATWRSTIASEELIAQELRAAELLPSRRPHLVTAQPGWCEGILATLRWAWQGAGPPPFSLLESDGRARTAHNTAASASS